MSQLDTWDKFVEVGQRISRDFDGDGVVDHYMIDLRFDGDWGLDTLMLQRGGQFFDPQGNVAFATEDTAELIRWYILQTRGPQEDRLRLRLGAVGRQGDDRRAGRCSSGRPTGAAGCSRTRCRR